MKKIIFIAMILLIVSCSKEEELNNCGCVETQEMNVDKKIWTGGAWMYYKEWEKTDRQNNLDGCYTKKETDYMVTIVSERERWKVTCNNKYK
jgi:hypothetical protein